MQILSMQLQTDSPALLYVAPCQTENCDNPNNTQEIDMEEEDDT